MLYYTIQLLAESTKRVSTALKDPHPEVIGAASPGFVISWLHDYMSVDLEVVWRIVEKDIPQLKAAVTAMLKE